MKREITCGSRGGRLRCGRLRGGRLRCGRLRHGSDPCADRRLGAQRLLVLAVVALDRVDLRDE